MKMLEVSKEEKEIASALSKITDIGAVVTVIKDLREQRVFSAEQEVKGFLLK